MLDVADLGRNTGTPQAVSLAVLAALCNILECTRPS